MVVEYGIEEAFRNIVWSDVFEFDDDFFIKLYDEDSGYNAVCIETGALCTFEKNDKVKWFPNAKLVIR